MRPWNLAHALRRKAAIRRVIDDKRDMIEEMKTKNEEMIEQSQIQQGSFILRKV